MKWHFSEIILLLVLVLLVSLLRVYYGADSFMIVWKGECNFKDTLVNLPELLSLPAEALAQEHQSVAWQLEDMGLIEPDEIHPKRPKKDQKPKKPGRAPDNLAPKRVGGDQ